MEIVLQKQCIQDGCVSACLAMLLNRPVGEVTNEFNEGFQKHDISIANYAKKNGIELSRPQDRDRVFPGGVYMLIVPSLNIPGMFHEILLDYRKAEDPKVFDPSTKQVYKLEPIDPGETKLTSWIIDYRVLHAPALGD